MKKNITLTLASLAIISSCVALISNNNVYASPMPPPEDIKIGDICIYSDNELEDYYDWEEGAWKKKEHVCEGKVEGISYDKETNVLTLNNYTGGEKLNAGNHQELTIKLIGENKIKDIDAAWMENDKDFTIIGPGSLTIEKGIRDETGANFYGSLVIDGATLRITNGGIYFYNVKIKDSDINIESSFKDDDGNYYFVGISAWAGLTIENSNISIKAEVPIMAGEMAKKEDDDVAPIILKGVKLGEGLKILTRKSDMNNLYTIATIGDANTKILENEEKGACGLMGNRCFEKIPTTVTIVKDSDDQLTVGVVDILEGADQEMNLKEAKDLTIRYNRDLDSFTKVEIDGNLVPKDQYSLKSGSTVLTIKADYIKNLKAGEHTVSAYFEGEEDPIETSLTLTIKSANTGSLAKDADLLIVFSLIILPTLAIASYSILNIKNRIKNKISFKD